MKKTMLSAVILLPLVVLLIMLISSTIISGVKNVYVESIEFADNSGTLVLEMPDEDNPPSETLVVNVLPLAATNKGLIFTSQDPSIVTVDREKGIVTAVDYGTTRIVVRSAEDASKTILKTVTVTDDKAHRIEFVNPISLIYLGQTEQLQVRFVPNVTASRVCDWKSDNESIAVSQDGQITANAVGESTITATSRANPNLTASIKIKVKAQLSSLHFENNRTETVAKSEIELPKVVLNDGADEEVTFSTDDPSIATVQDGKIVFDEEKFGKVTLTATATDGLGNKRTATKGYNYTAGYYDTLKFSQNAYDFDIDEVGSDPLDIQLITEDGAYKGFEGVTLSQEGIVEFDEATKTFTAKSRGRVDIQYTVKNCKGEEIVATCTVNIKKYIKTITFTPSEENKLDITHTYYNLADKLTFNPTEHDDTFLFYSCNSEVASVDNYGLVTFTAYGRADITIKAEKSEPIVVTLTFKKAEDSGINTIYVDETYDEKSTIVLDLESELSRQTCKLLVAESWDSAEYVVESGNDTIISFKDNIITPLQEGEATIKVTAQKGGESLTKTIKIYSNQLCTDIMFEKEDGWASLKYPAGYAFTLQGITANLKNRPYSQYKEIKVTMDETNPGVLAVNSWAIKYVNTTDWANYTMGFVHTGGSANGIFRFKVGVYYARTIDGTQITKGDLAGVEKTYSFSVETLRINEIKISYEGQEITEGQEFLFEDIREPKTFFINKVDLIPEGASALVKDFVTVEDKEGILENFVIEDVENGFNVTLMGKKTAFDPTDITFMYNGTKIKTIKVIVNALGEKIVASSNGLKIVQGDTYNAVSQEIVLTANFEREDGLEATEEEIVWESGKLTGTIAPGEQARIKLDPDATEVKLHSAKASLTFNVNILLSFDDFGLRVLLAGAQIYETESVVETQAATVTLPNAESQLSLEVEIENFVGLFTNETLSSMFTVSTTPNTFEVGSNGLARRFFVIVPAEVSAQEDITLSHNDISFTINLSRSDVAKIEFLQHYATDGVSTNGYGVYRGAQQVRLFAKHSYYNGSEVDYYKMPINVIGTLEKVEWQLVGYTGADKDGVIATVKGRNFTVDGATYTINEDGSVSNEDGEIVVTAEGKNTLGLTFVDCLTEKGFARIYFGNFNGLNESDIEKDNFGNFDMDIDPTYNNPYDQKGRFLRVTASAGATSDISCSFNFNVVNDTFDVRTAEEDGPNAKQNVILEDELEYYKQNGYKEKRLVNIFDAEGFGKYAYVVLQTNLYGPKDQENTNKNLVISGGEYEKTYTDKDTLDDYYARGVIHKGPLRKNLIYGNGYSINLDELNSATLKTDLPRAVVSVGRVYNATLEGATVQQGQSKLSFKVIFEGTRFYYSNIQAVLNGVISPNHQFIPLYVKNSTFKYAGNSAIEMWELKADVPGLDEGKSKPANEFTPNPYHNKEQYYIENVVIVDCVKGIESALYDTNPITTYKFRPGEFFFKGYVDVFNYQTENELVETLSGGENIDIVKNSSSYKDLIALLKEKYMVDFNGEKYVNIALITMKRNMGDEERTMYFFDEEQGTYNASLDDSAGSTHLKREIVKFDLTIDAFDAWLYAQDNLPFDIACQKHILQNGGTQENTTHLAWHMSKVYRDLNIIGWSENPEAEKDAA